MNESENAALRHELGVDGEGNLLTDERRAERAKQINELVKRARLLSSELEDTMAEIRAQSSLDGREDAGQLNQLVGRAHDIRVEIQAIQDEVYVKSSTRYPALEVPTE